METTVEEAKEETWKCRKASRQAVWTISLVYATAYCFDCLLWKFQYSWLSACDLPLRSGFKFRHFSILPAFLFHFKVCVALCASSLGGGGGVKAMTVVEELLSSK